MIAFLRADPRESPSSAAKARINGPCTANLREYHALLPANRRGAQSTRIYTVVGPICTPGDTLYWAVALPELAPGDFLAIMDAGAYFVPFSTSFSFPRPAAVMVDNGQVRRLRRAEHFDDLIACDELNPARSSAES